MVVVFFFIFKFGTVTHVMNHLWEKSKRSFEDTFSDRQTTVERKPFFSVSANEGVSIPAVLPQDSL